MRGQDINELKIFSGSKYNKEYYYGCCHQQKVSLMPSVGVSPPHPSAQIAMRYSCPLGKTVVIPLLKACGILFADGNNHDSIFLIAFATRRNFIKFLSHSIKMHFLRKRKVVRSNNDAKIAKFNVKICLKLK